MNCKLKLHSPGIYWNKLRALYGLEDLPWRGGGGLYFLEPHNLLKWVARRRVLKPSSHSHLLYCLPCGLTVIHLRLCDRKKSLGARRFEPQWIRFTLAVNSCSGSGSAAVVSNCYQLAWILAVSRVASEVLRLEEMAEIQARSQPPIFFRQVEDGDRRCQSDLDILWRQNWWERSWCLNSNVLLTFANVFVALNFVTLLDFSEQDFILETVMRSYSRRLDFLELNP